MDTMTRQTTPIEPRRRRPGATSPLLVTVVVGVLLGLALGIILVVTGHTGWHTGRPAVTEDPTAPLGEPATVPTTLATVPVPDAVDFTAVVAGIVQASNDVRVHPDPGALLTFMESGNPLYGDALAGQSQLVSGAIHYDPAPAAPTVSKVRVIGRDPDLAVVNVTFATTPRYRVVDRAGQVISDSPAAADVSVQWKLHRTNGTWRLIAAQPI